MNDAMPDLIQDGRQISTRSSCLAVIDCVLKDPRRLVCRIFFLVERRRLYLDSATAAGFRSTKQESISATRCVEISGMGPIRM